MSEVDCRVRPSEWLCATGVLRLFGGFELAVAVCCDCWNLGSGCGACVRSSFLAAGGNNRAGVILIVDGTVLAVVVSVIAW